MLLIELIYHIEVINLLIPTIVSPYQGYNNCQLYKISPKRLRFYRVGCMTKIFKVLCAAAFGKGQLLFTIKKQKK